MKRLLSIGALVAVCGTASAQTWECTNAESGHVYKASQDVPGDQCVKITDDNPYATSSKSKSVYQVHQDSPPRHVMKAPFPAIVTRHSDQYCVKVGVLTASAARIQALGGSEADLLSKNARLVESATDEAEREHEETTRKILDNMVAYVFTVKPAKEEARLIGYRKCLAGDFD